ncbi:hypothetical protein BGZ96_007852, partial [Linnemannia gamsii]
SRHLRQSLSGLWKSLKRIGWKRSRTTLWGRIGLMSPLWALSSTALPPLWNLVVLGEFVTGCVDLSACIWRIP